MVSMLVVVSCSLSHHPICPWNGQGALLLVCTSKSVHKKHVSAKVQTQREEWFDKATDRSQAFLGSHLLTDLTDVSSCNRSPVTWGLTPFLDFGIWFDVMHNSVRMTQYSHRPTILRRVQIYLWRPLPRQHGSSLLGFYPQARAHSSESQSATHVCPLGWLHACQVQTRRRRQQPWGQYLRVGKRFEFPGCQTSIMMIQCSMVVVYWLAQIDGFPLIDHRECSIYRVKFGTTWKLLCKSL